MSKTNTECKFNDASQKSDVEMMIDTQVLPKIRNFKYLGSIIQRDGKVTSFKKK